MAGVTEYAETVRRELLEVRVEKIILLGGGGHVKVVIDVILEARKYKIIGIIDLEKKIGQKVLGIPIIASDSDMGAYFKKGIKSCFITLGAIGKPHLRIRLFDLVKRIGFELPNIVHPTAVVSDFAVLGEGNFIAAGAIIQAGANIGNNCIINTNAVIEHDCKIGDFAHIACGTTLSGGVTVGEYSHIGTGVSIIESVKIGSNTIIGAGSVVLEDFGNNIVAYGSPARRIRKNVSQ